MPQIILLPTTGSLELLPLPWRSAEAPKLFLVDAVAHAAASCAVCERVAGLASSARGAVTVLLGAAAAAGAGAGQGLRSGAQSSPS